MNKRILFIAPQPFFQWRGSPIRVKFNLLALSKLGYSVDLLTLPIGQDLSIEGVNIHRVANPFRIKNIPIGPTLWKVFFDLLLLIKGIYLCRKNHYDVIHGVEEAGFLAILLSKIHRSKSIFEKHSDPYSYKKGILKNFVLRSYAKVEKLTAKNVSAVICTGPGLVDQVRNMHIKTRAFNIFDIPSSLEDSSETQSNKIRERLLRHPEEIILTYVGSFAVYQGIDLLFSAIPEIVPVAPHSRFTIIGGNPAEIEARQKWLEERGVLDNVTFLGKVDPDTLPHYLKASDILLSPRGSGVNTPLKILDYMKAGKPIIATDHPSNRRLLDEDSAVFATPDSSSFAQAILLLFSSKDKRDNLGKVNRKLYEETFTFEHHCHRLDECYSYVLKDIPLR